MMEYNIKVLDKLIANITLALNVLLFAIDEYQLNSKEFERAYLSFRNEVIKNKAIITNLKGALC